jgi:peptide/nickel transport system substrate-binding protein
MDNSSNGPKTPALLLVLLAVLSLPGCERRSEPGSAKGSGAPHRGGTLVVAWTAEPGGVNELTNGINQLNGELNSQFFLHLLEEQPDFEKHPPTFRPQLARSFEWSRDHKTLTFRLRENVVWSDGVPVTADDVRFTWQAQIDPAIAWDSSFMKAAITDVEVVGSHVVRYHFARAYAKQLLDVNEGPILPKHVWGQLPFAQWRDSADWFKQHVVSDGPFLLGSWKQQQEIVLLRNPRYFEPGRPYLDRVVLRVLPDLSSRMTQLLNGDLDYISGISPRDARRVQASARLALTSYWFRTWVGVTWNNSNPLFSDPEIRRALTLAIDRQTLVDTIWGEYGRISATPIVSAVWASDHKLTPWPYDPEGARRILAANGWKDTNGDGVLDRGGKAFTFELASNTGNGERADAMVMIQDQLRKVGIAAHPQLLELNTLSREVDAGHFDAVIFGLAIDTSLDLTSLFHSKSIGSGNGPRYKNPEVDRLIERAMSRPDIVDSSADLQRIQEILHRDQPYTFLWESKRLNGFNRRVQGANPNLLSSLFHLEDWWVETRP